MAERAPAVLVVGAGPVGLTLATLLHRHGVAARVVDQNDGPVRESRATDVHARTLELLETVGLAGELIARGKKARAATFYGGGRRIARVPVHQLVDVSRGGAIPARELTTHYPFILGVPQYETERVLLEDLERQGGAVERGVRLEGLAQGPGDVIARLSRGGAIEEARFSFVAGCDGASSTVRREMGLSFEGLTYPEHFMLADLAIDWALDPDELHVFLSEHGFFQVLPMPGDRRVRLFLDVPLREAALDPTLETFRALAAARVHAPLTLRDPGWMSKFRVHRRMAPRYRIGRLMLAGDAAHVHSPVGGQGMNTGIQDAFNLAWKLALCARGRASDALLDSYHTERHAVAVATLSDTHFATRLSMIKAPVARELRDLATSMASAIGPFQRWIAEVTGELRVHMRNSPIVEQRRGSVLFSTLARDPANEHPSVADWIEFGGAPEAGTRPPDRRFGPEGAQRRLFSLLPGTRHLLLLFDGARPTPEGYANLSRIAAAVRASFPDLVDAKVVVPAAERPASLPDADAVLLDPGADLHCAFGAHAECAYLIRPDGYVGYRAQPADEVGIVGYLSRLFAASR
jgi:2-polyprenyl-6-methoxyphenol hydroxylase-like FAD-dependent oxidoreductase